LIQRADERLSLDLVDSCRAADLKPMPNLILIKLRISETPQSGRDRDGHWVVQGPKGLSGGLFIDRAEAVKFAMYESGKRPQAVIMVPGTLELDMSASPRSR
jgi:hypothetical protein